MDARLNSEEENRAFQTLLTEWRNANPSIDDKHWKSFEEWRDARTKRTKRKD